MKIPIETSDKVPLDTIWFVKDRKIVGRIEGINMDKQTDEPIHHFTSGASSSGNKPPYECLTPTLLRRAAMRMQKGLHYGKHNWKKGSKDKQFILDRLNHAFEHLVKTMQEIDSDIPMTDDDLAAVVVNCMFAMEYQNTNIVICAKCGHQGLFHQNTGCTFCDCTVKGSELYPGSIIKT